MLHLSACSAVFNRYFWWIAGNGALYVEQFISNLTYEVKSGNILVSRSDDVVARILQVKFEIGLFEDLYANKGLKSFIGQQVITCPHDSWIQGIAIVCIYAQH